MTAAGSSAAQRVALYLRVSTTRQAQHDVSIPDQRQQGEAWCAAHGHQLIDTFVDAGVSATSDRRPEFQRLIEAASVRHAPFDIILVHSFSRFFRDHFELEFHIRRLARNGVKLISITQAVGDDPMHVMMRRVMTLFDEYQSRENGKHTLRAMKENARQGFWNGSLPPIGYRIVEAERRGAKVKKTLAIDPMHADTVRLIYRLALSGDGTTGPMGVKAIVGYLNDRRIFTRDGGRWGVDQIHAILTRTTYVGQHRFNKRGKDSTRKADGEVITVAVPPLVDQATFVAVKTLLRDRNPKALAPHLISSPNMLTGLLHCAQCGGLMTMRTGKAGRYRYYACQKTARTDTVRCTGIAIPIDALDTLVAQHMMERLLDRKRIERILTTILERRQALIARDGAGRLDEVTRRGEEVRMRLERLRKAIEIGALDLEDRSLQERLAYLRALQARTAEEVVSLQAELDRAGAMTVSASMLSAVIKMAGQRLFERGDGFRREYASAFAGRIVAEADKVRITCTLS
ncbi:recombinase family protein [Neomegalonema perideroedes]|uniref:recombinase family protein n=1 Tax=Neomegalonema perideroedes TaxID=217219 RepID=UPI00035E469C|nr:recombinase family protein [Neomegalonema perideroedes]